MVAVGMVVAVRDTIHDYYAGDGNAALSFFYGELVDLAEFGTLAGAAMLLRNKPEFHKRLVLLGSISLLGAAYGRITELQGTYPYVFVGLICSMVAYDVASRRAVHAATAIGAGILLPTTFTQELIGDSSFWLAAAHDLLGV
jgi:hypothetical protein